jgi:hypothetical protein
MQVGINYLEFNYKTIKKLFKLEEDAELSIEDIEELNCVEDTVYLNFNSLEEMQYRDFYYRTTKKLFILEDNELELKAEDQDETDELEFKAKLQDEDDESTPKVGSQGEDNQVDFKAEDRGEDNQVDFKAEDQEEDTQFDFNVEDQELESPIHRALKLLNQKIKTIKTDTDPEDIPKSAEYTIKLLLSGQPIYKYD